MLISLFLGAFIGFISAIPVAGPVSAVIFSRGMLGKTTEGRWIAIGAAIIEGLYGFFAFFGFKHFLADLSPIILISNRIAAVLLFVLGIYFFRSQKMRHPVSTTAISQSEGKKGFFIGSGMSTVNPSLLASWTLTASAVYSLKLFEFTLLTCGLFSMGMAMGIMLWFFLLLEIMAKHRNRFKGPTLDRGLKLIGISLCALALWMVKKSF